MKTKCMGKTVKLTAKIFDGSPHNGRCYPNFKGALEEYMKMEDKPVYYGELDHPHRERVGVVTKWESVDVDSATIEVLLDDMIVPLTEDILDGIRKGDIIWNNITGKYDTRGIH